jgi:hypothetical protein
MIAPVGPPRPRESGRACSPSLTSSALKPIKPPSLAASADAWALATSHVPKAAASWGRLGDDERLDLPQLMMHGFSGWPAGL